MGWARAWTTTTGGTPASAPRGTSPGCTPTARRPASQVLPPPLFFWKKEIVVFCFKHSTSLLICPLWKGRDGRRDWGTGQPRAPFVACACRLWGRAGTVLHHLLQCLRGEPSAWAANPRSPSAPPGRPACLRPSEVLQATPPFCPPDSEGRLPLLSAVWNLATPSFSLTTH